MRRSKGEGPRKVSARKIEEELNETGRAEGTNMPEPRTNLPLLPTAFHYQKRERELI
jgi:hypothetical protein